MIHLKCQAMSFSYHHPPPLRLQTPGCFQTNRISVVTNMFHCLCILCHVYFMQLLLLTTMVGMWCLRMLISSCTWTVSLIETASRIKTSQEWRSHWPNALTLNHRHRLFRPDSEPSVLSGYLLYAFLGMAMILNSSFKPNKHSINMIVFPWGFVSKARSDLRWTKASLYGLWHHSYAKRITNSVKKQQNMRKYIKWHRTQPRNEALLIHVACLGSKYSRNNTDWE